MFNVLEVLGSTLLYIAVASLCGTTALLYENIKHNTGDVWLYVLYEVLAVILVIASFMAIY